MVEIPYQWSTLFPFTHNQSSGRICYAVSPFSSSSFSFTLSKTQPAGSTSSIPDMSTNNSLEAGDATQCHGLDDTVMSTTTACTQSMTHSPIVEYPPPIPVALRHPHLVASVKQYRSNVQQQQLKQHIVSESFIPVAPDMVKPPRRRRRPPFSYSSLIAQAILASDHEKLTLREIYKWIMEKYPALYDVNDTGWQVQ